MTFFVRYFCRVPSCREYLSSTAIEWESAIAWLKQQLQAPTQLSSAPNLSNEDNRTRSFQRTHSAQYTLEQAQSLLRQTTTPKSDTIVQETSSNESMELNNGHSPSTTATKMEIY